ncbi:MAG: aldo/keto reductase [Paralcaligenes sp.]
MNKRPLGRSGLHIAPLVLGTNVFGWNTDERTSHALLDRFFDSGLNAIDTADMYSVWAPGNQGGESETIIGNWFKMSAARRQKAVLITKVGAELTPDKKGLSAQYIVAAVERSLRRLQTDYIDLYLSHFPDPETPIEETLRAYETLISQGKVKAIGASNYSALQLREALTATSEQNLPRYEVLQCMFNLYDREDYEGEVRDLCIREGLGAITYYGLAVGFLSGKYRTPADVAKSKTRGVRMSKYMNERGFRILAALDTVAHAHQANLAEVALAWVMAREDVTAPISSATSIEQMDSLIRSTQLALSNADIALLDTASA